MNERDTKSNCLIKKLNQIFGLIREFEPFLSLTVYYDARLLAPNIDAVHLFTFDQKTPEYSPKEADFPSPIYGSYGRVPEDNIDISTRQVLLLHITIQ